MIDKVEKISRFITSEEFTNTPFKVDAIFQVACMLGFTQAEALEMSSICRPKINEGKNRWNSLFPIRQME